MTWQPPTDDGGSKITNYVVEKREDNRKTYVHVSSDPKECAYTVQRLTEGHEYEFRVMAQNKYGIGPPLYSEPEKARNLFSTQHFSICYPLFEFCVKNWSGNFFKLTELNLFFLFKSCSWPMREAYCLRCHP